MKGNKHIQSFNEHQENLNISDVRDSIINLIHEEIKRREQGIINNRKINHIEQEEFNKGAIHGLQSLLLKIHEVDL